MRTAAAIAFLFVVGVSAWGPAPKPVIPRWLDAASHGHGYVISVNTQTDAWEYEGFIELSYDFSANSMRSAWQKYGENGTSARFGESSFKNGLLKEYHSETNECSVTRVGSLSIQS